MRSDANKNTPVFLAHGERDPVVRYVWGKATKQLLDEKMGYPVEWHSYPNLDHSADPQEIADMEKWLQKRLPAQQSGTASRA